MGFFFHDERTKGRKHGNTWEFYASRELIHVSCCLLANGKWSLNEDGISYWKWWFSYWNWLVYGRITLLSVFVWFTFPIFRFTFGLNMLKTAFKSSLREVKGVFRLFNRRKQPFHESFEWSKRPSVSRICKPFPWPPIHVHHMSNPPPKKKQLQGTQYVQDFYLFFLTFFCFTAQKIIKRTNQQHHLKAPPPPSPNTLVFHDCIATHRHDDLDTFVTSVTLEFSRRPLKKTWVFTKKTIFWIKKFESSKIGHYYCNSLWLPECLVIFNIKIYQAYEHIIDMCLGWEGWHILNRKSLYGFALNN